jgi:DNA-binding NarL/FixJ family response regulator
MPEIRVLIVDDQPAFRSRLCQLLTYAGLLVVGEAGSISEAVDLARELQPALALVDVMLPGESGVDGIPKLKAAVKDLRIILMSAHQDSAQVLQQSARKMGAEMFVPKEDLDLEFVRQWTE